MTKRSKMKTRRTSSSFQGRGPTQRTPLPLHEDSSSCSDCTTESEISDRKAPMSRKRRHSVSDDGTSNISRHSSSSWKRRQRIGSQLAAAANGDPLLLLRQVQLNPDLYRRVLMEMVLVDSSSDQEAVSIVTASSTSSSNSSTGSSKQEGKRTTKTAPSSSATQQGSRWKHPRKASQAQAVATERSRSRSRSNSASSSSSSKQQDVLQQGFKWKDSQPLERFLKNNYEQYYRYNLLCSDTGTGTGTTGNNNNNNNNSNNSPTMSLTKLAFNNRLLAVIRRTAAQHNISLVEFFQEDVKLWGRIVQFYKTATETAKRRHNVLAEKEPEKSRDYLSAILQRLASRQAEEEEEEMLHRETTSRTGPTASWEEDEEEEEDLHGETSRTGLTAWEDEEDLHGDTSTASPTASWEEEEDEEEDGEASRASTTASWEDDLPQESTPAITFVSPEPEAVDPKPPSHSRKRKRTGIVHVHDTTTPVRLPPSKRASVAASNKNPLLPNADATDNINADKDTENMTDNVTIFRTAQAYASQLVFRLFKGTVQGTAEAVERMQFTEESSWNCLEYDVNSSNSTTFGNERAPRYTRVEKARDDDHGVKGHQSVHANVNQDMSEADPGRKSPNYEARDNARIPTSGRDALTVWKRLDAMDRGAAEGYPFAKDSPLIHLRTVHELIRTRLAAGMFRTALKVCHNSIMNLYSDAEEAVTRLPEVESLKSVRTELAGAWCLYAHILWEIGGLDDESAVDGATDKRKVAATTLRQAHTWKKHAVTVLKAATSCPLVGNHYWITLAMARLTILQNLGNKSSIDTSTSKTLESIQIAIDMCWDSIYRARGNPFEPRVSMDVPSREEMLLLASHEHCFPPLTKEKVTVKALQKSFGAVSALPMRLRGISSASYILVDRNSMSCVCTELNRLSRLQEKLGQHPDAPVSPAGYVCELDSFALFRARDVVLNATLPKSVQTPVVKTLAAPQAKLRVSPHITGIPPGSVFRSLQTQVAKTPQAKPCVSPHIAGTPGSVFRSVQTPVAKTLATPPSEPLKAPRTSIEHASSKRQSQGRSVQTPVAKTLATPQAKPRVSPRITGTPVSVFTFIEHACTESKCQSHGGSVHHVKPCLPPHFTATSGSVCTEIEHARTESKCHSKGRSVQTPVAKTLAAPQAKPRASSDIAGTPGSVCTDIELLDISSASCILDDKNSISFVRTKLNRRSRLQEKLGQHPNAPVSPVGSFGLFRARDVAPNASRVPLHITGTPGSACTNIEHACTKCQTLFDTARECKQHQSSSLHSCYRHGRPTTTPGSVNACTDIEYACTKCQALFDTARECKQHQSSSLHSCYRRSSLS
jgi:hypothetical protein